ncbi:MAG TPA: hypothetical protein VNO20_00590 [Solirubrobacterales bacterium]|nr:hypothetical protein [Solirubrobacterales bacterium]
MTNAEHTTRARAHTSPWVVALFSLTALLGMATVVADAQAAEPPLLRQFCEGKQGDPASSAGGRCFVPRGIAVDPASGDIYVADQGNDRVQKFTAWGQLLRTWGWDVVASGPGDDTIAPEDEFEICVPVNGDVCKKGIRGAGNAQIGQFGAPQGIAVDADGDVFVVDFLNNRVQKFNPNGDFLLMFGGNVNKTKVEALAPEAERNRCPVDPGDVCQAATQGSGSGQFGAWTLGSYITTHPGPPETIYVGDEERIQGFDTEGNYLGDLPDPEGLLAGRTVQALAVDPKTGALYAGFGKALDEVAKLNPASGARECTLKVARPSAIAVDASGQVHVVSTVSFSAAMPMQVMQFSGGTCAETSRFNAEEAGFAESTAIAASSACGIDGVDLLLANSFGAHSFIRLYGPPPDIGICPPPSVPPTIKAQHALSVSTTDAIVRAQVNPHFWPDTTYWVQYGTEDCASGPSACESKALFPGAPLNSGVVDAFKTAGVTLTGLEPDTTYHYRFVAESQDSGAGPAFGEGEAQADGSFHTYPPPSASPPCPNDAFRAGLGVLLPECRAYELVSPLDKNNGDITTGQNSRALASLDGGGVTYSSYISFAGPQGAPLVSQYLSRRDPEQGWSSAAISPPRGSFPFFSIGQPVNDLQFRAFTEDLCQGWLIQDTDVAYAEWAPPGVANLYRRLDPSCGAESYELLTTSPPPGFSREAEPSESAYAPTVQGFSADGSRTLLRVNAALTADACKASPEEGRGRFQLYMAHEGSLRLVSVLPTLAFKPSCKHASAGTSQGPLGSARASSVEHAVSADGTRVFWSTAGSATDSETPNEDGDQPGPLYVRLNPTGPIGTDSRCNNTAPGEACTARISNDDNARFWGADAEGTTAVYTNGPLALAKETGSTELFEYDVASEASTLIAKGVRGVAGISEDAGRVYFASDQVLTGEAANSEGDKAVAGEPNLYLHERGEGFSFIATLSILDVFNEVTTASPPSPIATFADRRSARTSPDGTHLAFTSAAPLTGFDSTDAQSGQPDGQVFLYDAETAELVCVSCNPSGARPNGREMPSNVNNGATVFWAAAQLPGWEYQLHPTRLLSGSGERLFFESFDALVLRDTNGRQDVYEWQRAESKEQCAKEGADVYSSEASGCISLISSGQSSQDTQFVDASASGSDVFFTTTSSLVPQDFGLVDVYDARAGGGFPVPPGPDPTCEGEACQGTPAPPDDPTPTSSTFEGAGNLQEQKGARPRCAKGKARRKGRCVSRKQAKRKRASHRRRAGR